MWARRRLEGQNLEPHGPRRRSGHIVAGFPALWLTGRLGGHGRHGRTASGGPTGRCQEIRKAESAVEPRARGPLLPFSAAAPASPDVSSPSSVPSGVSRTCRIHSSVPIGPPCSYPSRSSPWIRNSLRPLTAAITSSLARCSDVYFPRRPERQRRRVPRGEKTPLGGVHHRPQSEAGEICGLKLVNACEPCS